MVRALRIVALSVFAMLCSAQIAVAQDPIVIPVITTPEPANPIPADKFQPMQPPEKDEAGLWYPEVGSGIRFPKQYAALKVGGYVSLLGNVTVWTPIWDDVGSGVPIQQGSIGSRWKFPLPGKYSYRCQCPLGVRGEGDVYVVGPRPRFTPVLTSADNKPPVSYMIDASASSVTDWKQWSITKYDFDLNVTDFTADGIYSSTAPDQSGPEPTVPLAFDVPGGYTMGLRVWDNYDSDPNTDGITPRSQDVPLEILVPKRVAEPAPIKPIDDSIPKAGTLTGDFARTFKTNKIKLTTRSKISLSVLRKNGLSVKVSGLRNGDVLGTTLTKGKLIKGKKSRKVGAARTATASSTSVTIRVRLSKKARSILRTKPRAKTVRLAVLIEGTDGFVLTKAKNIRLG